MNTDVVYSTFRWQSIIKALFPLHLFIVSTDSCCWTSGSVFIFKDYLNISMEMEEQWKNVSMEIKNDLYTCIW